MKIPKEIQDLMPENPHGCCYKSHPHGCEHCAFNAALTEVEAVLPQMLALAEKRGAEGEREQAFMDGYLQGHECGHDLGIKSAINVIENIYYPKTTIYESFKK